LVARRLLVAVTFAALIGVSGFVAYEFILSPRGPCLPLGGTKPLRSTAERGSFGALTEYRLPSPGRWANAIEAAPDGSVWFGEQSVPGVGHLFTNGTLLEYPWPSAAHPRGQECGFQTSIWGIAAWNGMIWGTSGDENALIGANPQTGAVRIINVTGQTTFPYTLALAPDGSLWFTALAATAVLGRVAPDFSVHVYPVAGLGREVPTQVDFLNSTYAYFVALNPLNNSGGLFTFNPSALTSAVTPRRVGGPVQLFSPNSVSAQGSSVWITQHGAASVAAFDVASGVWTTYPTSPENYSLTTLPYFVAVSGDRVWFNEHYGNKIALLDPASKTMTEFSEANPPVTNGSAIENDLTIAAFGEGLWFTSTTGNYIGFVDGNDRLGFSLSAQGGSSTSVQPGGTTKLEFALAGSWSKQLSLLVSDSEQYTSVPKMIKIEPSSKTFAAGVGPMVFQASVTADSLIRQGRYTLAVTVTDGLVYQTAFVFLTIS